MRQRVVACGCFIVLSCGLAVGGAHGRERPAALAWAPIAHAHAMLASSPVPSEPPFYAVIFGGSIGPRAILVSSDGRRYELPMNVAGGVFAPRGAVFAYTLFSPSKRAEVLHVMRLGGSERAVTLLSQGGAPPLADPVFASDGRIVYASGRATRYLDGPTFTLKGVPGIVAWVAPSPSDPRTFAVTLVWGNGSATQYTAIYIVSAAGNHRVPVMFDAWSESPQPIWSPNGEKIAFVRCGCSTGGDIYIANADGSHVVQLTHSGQVRRPLWSPDGKQIAFTHQTGGKPEVYVTTLNGAQRQLTHTKVLPGLPIQPGSVAGAWSPDGRWIAVFSNYWLGVVPAAGGAVRTVVSNLSPHATLTAAGWPQP